MGEGVVGEAAKQLIVVSVEEGETTRFSVPRKTGFSAVASSRFWSARLRKALGLWLVAFHNWFESCAKASACGQFWGISMRRRRSTMIRPSSARCRRGVSLILRPLTMMEYFISTHGARKGLADTALKTARPRRSAPGNR